MAEILLGAYCMLGTHLILTTALWGGVDFIPFCRWGHLGQQASSALRFKPGYVLPKPWLASHIIPAPGKTCKQINQLSSGHIASSKAKSSLLKQEENLQGLGLNLATCQWYDSEPWPWFTHLPMEKNNTPITEGADRRQPLCFPAGKPRRGQQFGWCDLSHLRQEAGWGFKDIYLL